MNIYNYFSLGNVEGVMSILISTLIVKGLYLPKFILYLYLNPASMYYWFSVKNNFEEKHVDEIYNKKDRVSKVKSYFSYISLLALTNCLDIYF